MPSPLIHAAAGVLIYRGLPARHAEMRPGLFWLGVLLSWLPDLDAVPGVLLGDMGRYHNHMMGSPAFALLAALCVGLAGRAISGAFRPWYRLALTCFLVHILLDYFTRGRGTMLLWPFSETRFSPPFPLFYGVHWSDGLFSSSHFLTVLSELATLAVVLLAAAGLARLQRRRAG